MLVATLLTRVTPRSHYQGRPGPEACPRHHPSRRVCKQPTHRTSNTTNTLQKNDKQHHPATHNQNTTVRTNSNDEPDPRSLFKRHLHPPLPSPKLLFLVSPRVTLRIRPLPSRRLMMILRRRRMLLLNHGITGPCRRCHILV